MTVWTITGPQLSLAPGYHSPQLTLALGATTTFTRSSRLLRSIKLASLISSRSLSRLAPHSPSEPAGVTAQTSSLALVIVSHDREFLDRVCTKIVETEQGVAYSHNGNYRSFLKFKLEREELQVTLISGLPSSNIPAICCCGAVHHC